MVEGSKCFLYLGKYKGNTSIQKQITNWIASIGNKPLRNTSGGSYRSLPDDKKDWNDAQWAEAFSRDAMLLKRPLFEKDGIALCTGFRNSDVIQSHSG